MRNISVRQNKAMQALLAIAAFSGMSGTAFGQASPAKMQNAAAPVAQSQQQVPTAETMVVLIRSSVLALGQANLTNNYSVLSSLGSNAFRTNNSPAKLSSAFQAFRTNRIDLSPVAMLAPQLTMQPAMTNGRMRLVGNFPSRPMQVNFDLTYEPEEGAWKLGDMSVNLNRVQ